MGKLEVNYNGNKHAVDKNPLLKNIIFLTGIFEILNRKNLEELKLDFIYASSEFDLIIKPDRMKKLYKTFMKNTLVDIVNNKYIYGFIDGLK